MHWTRKEEILTCFILQQTDTANGSLDRGKCDGISIFQILRLVQDAEKNLYLNVLRNLIILSIHRFFFSLFRSVFCAAFAEEEMTKLCLCMCERW